MTLYFILAVLGLLVSFALFSRFPTLDECGYSTSATRISVIIPARNEERNLPLLLGDLLEQTFEPFEILCIDDGSTDTTGAVASKFGVELITLDSKPEGWIGKSWACQNGADAAEGELLLFLDADVRLDPNGISRLFAAYERYGCVISVQPYHQMEKAFEQFSLFFNLVQFAANGLGLRRRDSNVGLSGPVILIGKSDYSTIGGHAAIKDDIVDDIALGRALKSSGISFKLFLGDKVISYRMYSGGFMELVHGWEKNQSTGVVNTPPLRMIIVFLWVTSCISAPLYLSTSILAANSTGAVTYLILYVIWVIELFRISVHLGDYRIITILVYPIYLLIFVGVFISSFVKMIFHRNVMWKDRKIRIGI